MINIIRVLKWFKCRDAVRNFLVNYNTEVNEIDLDKLMKLIRYYYIRNKLEITEGENGLGKVY